MKGYQVGESNEVGAHTDHPIPIPDRSPACGRYGTCRRRSSRVSQSIQQDRHDESNEGDARTNRPTLIPHQWASYKLYSLVVIVALGVLLALRRPSCSRSCVAHNPQSSDPFYFRGRLLQVRRRPFCSWRCMPRPAFEGPGLKHLRFNIQDTTQNNASSNANTAAFVKDDAPNVVDTAALSQNGARNECETKDDCGSGEFCCRNRCNSCCVHSDCASKIDQPPAGEFGKALCIDNECRAYLNGESSQIPSDGYPVWVPSETIDNSKKYRKINMPRIVYDDGPLMEQVWHIDFNQQDESFDKNNKFEYNSTHITIPSFDSLHTAYSRSYNHYGEHETGITSLIMADNTYSVVADFPKLIFVEKYHTLTYEGIKDTTRGDDIKQRAKEQLAAKEHLAENLVFDRTDWENRAKGTFFHNAQHDTIQRQVEAGVDKGAAWQVRRYVNSYPDEDVGSVNRSSSDSWGRHSEKAKEAIDHAKNPSFERDYFKSELHCKHFEELDGVSYTEDTVTFPLGRPITGLSGEMVTSPVHYVGFGVGHITLQYNPSKHILEIFYQTFSHSRQHADIKYPGPYPNGLYVAPVTDGTDYVVDPDRDGRTDGLFLADPPDDNQLGGGEADFTLWARPTEDVCDKHILSDPFWENIDGYKFDYGSESDLGDQLQYNTKGVLSMPCAGTYMRTDYDGGTSFDVLEMGVWHHSLVEIRHGHTKDMLLASFWDDWECFYRKRCNTA